MRKCSLLPPGSLSNLSAGSEVYATVFACCARSVRNPLDHVPVSMKHPLVAKQGQNRRSCSAPYSEPISNNEPEAFPRLVAGADSVDIVRLKLPKLAKWVPAYAWYNNSTTFIHSSVIFMPMIQNETNFTIVFLTSVASQQRSLAFQVGPV